eukprot:8842047-Alexandrium_andersonii.AAC.1
MPRVPRPWLARPARAPLGPAPRAVSGRAIRGAAPCPVRGGICSSSACGAPSRGRSATTSGVFGRSRSRPWCAGASL